MNYKSNIFPVIQDTFMVSMHKMYMEKTLPESLASVSTSETPLALISMSSKNSEPVIKQNSINPTKEEIN